MKTTRSEQIRDIQFKRNYGRQGLMITAAVRYCVGRMSYIVSDCCDWIIENWESWPDHVKQIIKRDIEEEFKRDDEARAEGYEYKPLGMDMDRKQWERVRRLWNAQETQAHSTDSE